MIKQNWIILFLCVALIGIVTFEQIFTDNAISELVYKTEQLETHILNSQLDLGKEKAQEIENLWKQKEIAISFFVDYRDIEQIARQINLVNSHLQNEDFELAKVECELLLHIVKTFKNQISFDWQNII